MEQRQIRPEITRAMACLESAVGSPRFPKIPLVDTLQGLIDLMFAYEAKLGLEAGSTWPYIEAGWDQVDELDRGTVSLESRPSLRINVEAVIDNVERARDESIEDGVWLNLLANVIGQISALLGIDKDRILELSHDNALEAAYMREAAARRLVRE